MECKALSSYQARGLRNAPTDPGFRARLAGRVIWQRMQLGEVWYKASIEPLMAHEDDDVFISELNVVLKYLCESVEDPDLDMNSKLAKLGFPNLDEVRNLFRRIRTHYLDVPCHKSRAKALCSIVSTINHSCDPNVVFATPAKDAKKDAFVHIVAVKDIKPGEELTASYTMSFEPYMLRQAHLRIYAHVQECKCGLCIENKKAIEGKSTRVDPREALWCGRADCKGWVALDWSESKVKPRGLCSGCKQPCILDAQKVASVIKQGKDIWENVGVACLQGSKGESKKNIPPTLIRDLTAMQPPCAYPLLGLLGHFGQGLMETQFSFFMKGKHQEAFRMQCEVYRCCMLVMAGCSAGKQGSVVYEGHNIRQMNNAILLQSMRDLCLEKNAGRKWDKAPPSRFFNRLPSIPPPCRDLGVATMKQALQDLKCAYGDEAKRTDMYQLTLDSISGWGIRVLSLRNPNSVEDMDPRSGLIDSLTIL